MVTSTSTEQGSKAMNRNMRCFFIFMLILLTIRTVYQLFVVFNSVNFLFSDVDESILNLALLVPYITEVIFNSVIFYYNFFQEE